MLAIIGGAGMAREYEANPENFAEIVGTLKPGDVVTLADGEYAGGIVLEASGAEGLPIVIKAGGENVLFRGGRDGLRLAGDYITLDGLKVTGAERGGITSGRNTGCTVRNCTSFDNGVWGIFSGFSEHFTVEGNTCYGSKKEHGIYLSNSADHAVVRGNHCYDNAGCGIQFNGDPYISGGDGVMSFNLVEGNILHHNWTNLNLTCVSDSVIRNNLFYGCRTKAVALWDTLAGHEYASKDNILINNTFIMDLCTREAIQIRNGSTGNVIRNNIFVADFQAVIVDGSAVEGTLIDHNLYSGSREPERFIWAGEYRSVADMQEAGFCEGAVIANPVFTGARQMRRINLDEVPAPVEAVHFVDWKAGDFRLAPESPAVDAGATDEQAGALDLAGSPRVSPSGIDIGAYEF